MITKSKYVQVRGKDRIRERNFKDVYGLECHIEVTNYNDDNWNWDMCVLNFKDSIGKTYGLIEYFKSRDDNSTDHVDLEYEDKDGKFTKETFDKFIDAELRMVEIMKSRIEGKG